MKALIESMSKREAQRTMDDWRDRQKKQKALDRFQNERGYGYELEIEPPEIGDDYIYNYTSGKVYDKKDVEDIRAKWNEAAIKFPGNLAKITKAANLDDGINIGWLKSAINHFRLR